MCLSRSGVRSISGLSRAFSTNGATAFTSWVSSSSTDGHLGQREPPRVPLAQVDLLQVLVEPALREEVALRIARRRAAAAPATARRVGQPAIAAHRSTRGGPLRAGRRRAALVRAEQRAAARASSLERLGLERPSCAGRTPGGRRTVWHALFTMKSSRSRVGVEVAAERLDARRVAQVEAEDLEPVAPLVEVGLLRVAERGVAREPGGDDRATRRRAAA